MSRLGGCFEQLKEQGRKALIPYIMAGDPTPDITVPLMHCLVESGVDIIELGVPFSDPMADGPVIQEAAERALVHKVSLSQVLEIVKRFRQQDNKTPVVLMGYLNPMEVMGVSHFCAKAKGIVDGVLTVDLPPEEAGQWSPALQEAQIDPIFLIAPTTDDARIKFIAEHAKGYLYYVSIKGVTGAGNLDIQQVTQKLTQIRQHTHIPVGVGFGIEDAESAALVAQTADAVVVGSAIIQKMTKNKPQIDQVLSDVGEFVGSLRQAIDA